MDAGREQLGVHATLYMESYSPCCHARSVRFVSKYSVQVVIILTWVEQIRRFISKCSCSSGSLMDMLRHRHRFTKARAHFFKIRVISALLHVHSSPGSLNAMKLSVSMTGM